MCVGPEKTKSASSQSSSASSIPKEMNSGNHETDDSVYRLLELASDDDAEVFKRSMCLNYSLINRSAFWYVRRRGSKQVVREHRTPLMVAATYGSINVLKIILSCPEVDVNLASVTDGSTALHCAASGGSINAIEVCNLLLSAGADPNSVDSNGDRSVNVILVHLKLQKVRLEELLKNDYSNGSADATHMRLFIDTSSSKSSTFSSSPDGVPSPPDSVCSPLALKLDGPVSSLNEKKEYPVDPSLPDIKNSIYATDEFRMFSFKVRPCSRAYSHDWTECPFVHPGENARRRDPRKFHYSCVPCPDFRKGACRRGDLCEYAHGVFECWLHPAQYRTRLCKDGTHCNRRVCFFAHTAEELRPLYVSSTGSGVASPRSTASAPNVMDMAAAMSLLPSSPSSVSAMSPTPFSQSMSPSLNNISHTSGAWPQPNVPTLHLPGSNLQSSRLRSSLSARDMQPEDLNAFLDFESQQKLLNELACFSQSRSGSVSMGRAVRSKTLNPSNLEELFSAEISSSPRFSDPAVSSVFSPTHKSAMLNQFQQQQKMLSPINTRALSPKTVEHHPLLQASLGVSSPGRMSPRSIDPISPMSSRLSPYAQREKHFQLLSLSSRDLGSNIPVGSPVNSWSKWGSPNGEEVDWSAKKEDSGQLRRSSSFELGANGEEPDLSWVQSLVRESPPEIMKEKSTAPLLGVAASAERMASKKSQFESVDHSVLGAWLEQMQLDQLEV